MKTSCLFILVLLFSFTMKLNAQKTGKVINLTANYFKQGKIEYAKNSNKKYKLYLHMKFNTFTIKVVLADTVIFFVKQSMYAYQDKPNTNNPYFNSEPFKFIVPSEKISLYRQVAIEDRHRISHQVTRNYFS